MLTFLSETTSTYFLEDVSTPVSLTLEVFNNAAAQDGNDILSASGTGYNFYFEIKLSDNDLKTDSDGISITEFVPDSINPDLSGGLAAQDTLYFTITGEILIPAIKCNTVEYLCIVLTIPDNATYVDADVTGNNCCTSLISPMRLSCNPGTYDAQL